MRPSDLGLLVLHALRLSGFADAETVARRLGVDTEPVARILADTATDGLTRERRGTRPGWSLTDEGRKENERLLAEELDGAGLRAEVTATYRAFLPLNRELLAACTDWQVIDQATGTLNDHTDPDHDRAVIDRLIRIDRQIQPRCAELSSWFERFAGYGQRLASAIDRIERGETDYVTKPTIDSYHTIWFELHEDLLATLGLERTSEAEPGPGHEPATDLDRSNPNDRTTNDRR